MFFTSISALALTLLAAAQPGLALPVTEGSTLEARADDPTLCHTILKGYLVGFDSGVCVSTLALGCATAHIVLRRK